MNYLDIGDYVEFDNIDQQEQFSLAVALLDDEFRRYRLTSPDHPMYINCHENIRDFIKRSVIMLSELKQRNLIKTEVKEITLCYRGDTEQAIDDCTIIPGAVYWNNGSDFINEISVSKKKSLNSPKQNSLLFLVNYDGDVDVIPYFYKYSILLKGNL